MTSQICTIGNVRIGEGRLALIAGPCVAESRDLCLRVATEMSKLCGELGIGYVFKASYDKANRSSYEGFRGPGLETGLKWLAEVRDEVGSPVLTDVHETSQVAAVAEVADCVQIPAFLCRQTDLLTEAGKLARAVNIKKGQFMAPWDMAGAVEKVRSAGGQNVAVTERGTCFGYNRLVTDFRGIPQMRQFAPVVFDATHSVQEPGALGSASGGKREFAPVLAAAAVAVGADALFVETHPEPAKAKSDAASQLPLSEMRALLKRCLAIAEASKS
ncbi:MAG: 3-deoxy-8-phosphooctulonate synthase [Phycisphaerae bacterium]